MGNPAFYLKDGEGFTPRRTVGLHTPLRVWWWPIRF